MQEIFKFSSISQWSSLSCQTAFHQWKIYSSYYEMESVSDEWKTSFPKWFNTKTEYFIRCLAFVLLLLAVGKFHQVLDWGAEFFVLGDRSFGHPLTAMGMALWASAALFTVHVAWSLGSILARRRADVPPSNETIKATRCFLLSDGLAAGLWFAMALSVKYGRVHPIVLALIVVLLGSYVTVMYFRFRMHHPASARPKVLAGQQAAEP
jgi:hypothetical protein